MKITINSENLNKKRKIDLSKVALIAKTVLKSYRKRNAELNIIFLSDQKIRALNKKYLGKNKSTDVLAFCDDKAFPEKKTKKFRGDVAISSDKAAQNAALYKTSFKKELALYIIHGILHLLGYRDKLKKDQKIMREKENEFLQKIKKFL